jgi:hypothetical protein
MPDAKRTAISDSSSFVCELDLTLFRTTTASFIEYVRWRTFSRLSLSGDEKDDEEQDGDVDDDNDDNDDDPGENEERWRPPLLPNVKLLLAPSLP